MSMVVIGPGLRIFLMQSRCPLFEEFVADIFCVMAFVVTREHSTKNIKIYIFLSHICKSERTVFAFGKVCIRRL